jgi:hypothetical protein
MMGSPSCDDCPYEVRSIGFIIGDGDSDGDFSVNVMPPLLSSKLVLADQFVPERATYYDGIVGQLLHSSPTSKNVQNTYEGSD